MTSEEQLSGSTSDRVIETGETYDHTEHGPVEITAIWHRTQRLDTTRKVDSQDMVVVRYIPGEDGKWSDELAESLSDLLNAIN